MQLTIYVNGMIYPNNPPDKQVKMTSEIKLGNEMSGLVADFNIWSRSIGEEEVLDFIKHCKSISKDGIWLDWSTQSFQELNGTTTRKNVSHGEICHGEKGHNVVSLDHLYEYKDAKHICQNLGGEITVHKQDVSIFETNLFSIAGSTKGWFTFNPHCVGHQT